MKKKFSLQTHDKLWSKSKRKAGDRSFRQHVRSPTYEVDSARSNVSSPTRLNYRIEGHFLVLHAYQLLFLILLFTAEPNVGKLTFDVGESTSYCTLANWHVGKTTGIRKATCEGPTQAVVKIRHTIESTTGVQIAIRNLKFEFWAVLMLLKDLTWTFTSWTSFQSQLKHMKFCFSMTRGW